MTPEGKVKKLVRELLHKHDVYYFMPVQQGMGSPSLDFLCCHRGRFFAIETKGSNTSMTLRQRATAEAMENAGAAVFLVTPIMGYGVLQKWLEMVDAAY